MHITLQFIVQSFHLCTYQPIGLINIPNSALISFCMSDSLVAAILHLTSDCHYEVISQDNISTFFSLMDV